MDSIFHAGNRKRFYEQMKPYSALILFAGCEIRKTNDEYYPFFADRSFVYMTGIEQKESILLAYKDSVSVKEQLYLLPPDAHAERWTGRRLKPCEAEAISGISDIRPLSAFENDLHTLTAAGHYSRLIPRIENIYLDVFKASVNDIDKPSHLLLKTVQQNYPYLHIENANAIIRKLRLIKQACEIEALRKGEAITRDGILAMMKASKPGMYEYQYKAEFERALSQYSAKGPGFPPIISSGNNNFCIHYYSYTGKANDGDMILTDVGAQWDNLITDVSRGFPCNGRFTDRQKLIFDMELAASNHMFETVKPGMAMSFIDEEIKRFTSDMLVSEGLIKNASEVGKLMWHGGSHHIGYDVHDVVMTPESISPGMVFCIDVGIYCEDWGIGFRLEDNLLVTENGCENLSAGIPRTVHDIEAIMRH